MSILNEKERSKGSFINLKQLLLQKTRLAQNANYIVISNNAWKNVVTNPQYQSFAHIPIIIESLTFSNEDVMSEVYGKNFTKTVEKFLAKLPYEAVEKNIAQNSYATADALKKQTDIFIEQYLSELEDKLHSSIGIL